MHSRLTVLRSIERRDPEGWTQEPTERQRRLFQFWVIDTFGLEVWKEYERGGWERRD